MIAFAAAPRPASAVPPPLILSPVSDAFGVDQPRNGVFDNLYPTSPANIVGGNSSAEYRSVLEFSLAGLPAGSVINSAVLNLYTVAWSFSGTQTMSMYVHSYAGNGIAELSDLYVTHPVAGPFTMTSTSTPRSLAVDLTTAIADLENSNAAYAGLVLRVSDVPSADYTIQWGSQDTGIIESRPTLQIAY
jgi:hypothetical protein